MLLVINPYKSVDESDSANDTNDVFAYNLLDLVATDLSWNPDAPGLTFTYEVGMDLPTVTTAAPYWASGESFDQRRGGPASSVDPDPSGSDSPMATISPSHVRGGHGPITLPDPGTPPSGADYLLVVLDRPDSTHPLGQIVEGNENNNLWPLYVPAAPTIALFAEHADGFVVSGANPVAKGEAYELTARVTNNESAPPSRSQSTGQKCSSHYLGLRTRRTPPHQSQSHEGPAKTQDVRLGTYQHQWEWIPQENPIGSEKWVKNYVKEAAENVLGVVGKVFELVGEPEELLEYYTNIGLEATERGIDGFDASPIAGSITRSL